MTRNKVFREGIILINLTAKEPSHSVGAARAKHFNS